jgi:hypothetical protein
MSWIRLSKDIFRHLLILRDKLEDSFDSKGWGLFCIIDFTSELNYFCAIFYKFPLLF